MTLSFSVKLMNGLVIPIEIDNDSSLINIYTSVSNILPKELKCTRHHLKLFSLREDYEDPIKCLYHDIIESKTIGCYIDEVRVYIDNNNYTEHYIEDDEKYPYTIINFVVINKDDSILLNFSVYESNGKFFKENDIIKTGEVIYRSHTDFFIMPINNNVYNSIEELFLSNPQFSSLPSHENIILLAKKSYDEYQSGFVEVFENEMKWLKLSETELDI
jgi:hypothetical protein